MIWLMLTLVVCAVSISVVAETIKHGKDNVIRRTGKELAEAQVFRVVATKLAELVLPPARQEWVAKKMEAIQSSAQSLMATVGLVFVGIVALGLVLFLLPYLFGLLVSLVGLVVG